MADLDPDSTIRDDRTQLWNSLKEGKSNTIQTVQRRKDGSELQVEIHLYATSLDNQPIILPIVLDISGRKHAEAALKKSEERFRVLYEQTPLGYQSLNKNGTFVEVNKAWLDMMGYSREEVIGRYFGDFLAPHELDAFKERFTNFVSCGKVNVDLRMVKKDGSQIIVHIDGQVGYDEAGQFKQTHCILHDITDRKLAEAALKESEEKYRQVFETNQAVKLIIDPADGRIVKANRAACDFYGYSKDELLLLKITDINVLPPLEVQREMDRAKNVEKLVFEFRHKLNLVKLEMWRFILVL